METLYGYTLEDFRDEARELLTRAEGILSEIAAFPNDSSKVNALFRVIHSLKGSAAYAGLRDVDSFAHLYENLLGELRNSQGAVASDTLAVLIRARDYLEDLVFNPEKTEGSVIEEEAGTPLQQLSNILKKRGEPSALITSEPNPHLNPLPEGEETIFPPPHGDKKVAALPFQGESAFYSPPLQEEGQSGDGVTSTTPNEPPKGTGGIRPLSPPLGEFELEAATAAANQVSHKIVLSTEDPVKMDQKDVIKATIRNHLKSLFSVLKTAPLDTETVLKILKKMEESALWAFGDDASAVLMHIAEMRGAVSAPSEKDVEMRLKKVFNALSLGLKELLFSLGAPQQEKREEAKEIKEATEDKKITVSPEEVRGASKDDIVKITLANTLETLDEIVSGGPPDPFHLKKALKRLRDLNTWAFDDNREAGTHIKFLEDLGRRPYDETMTSEMRESAASLKSLFATLMGEKDSRKLEVSSQKSVVMCEEKKQERYSPVHRFTDSPVTPIVEYQETRGQRPKPSAPTPSGSTLRVRSEDLESLISTIGELAGLDPKDFEKLQAQALQLRMVPVGELFGRFRKVVRDISEELGKDMDLEISGESVKLDKVIADRLNEPIMHMVRNAAAHGLETPDERREAGKNARGVIRLNAFQEGGQIIIEVSDDGRGISLKAVRERAIEMGLIKSGSENSMSDKAVLDLIFAPGFSTTREADRVSGRGVGMDVVKEVIASIQGTVFIETKEGRGTTFRLQVPLTLAVIKAMVLEQSGSKIALPSAFVDRVITMTEEEIEAESIMDDDRLSLDLAGEGDVLPIVDLAKLFGIENRSRTRCVVLVKAGMGQKAALIVDGTLGRQPIMVKPLDRFAENRYFSSAAFVDNELILVLNTPSLMQ